MRMLGSHSFRTFFYLSKLFTAFTKCCLENYFYKRNLICNNHEELNRFLGVIAFDIQDAISLQGYTALPSRSWTLLGLYLEPSFCLSSTLSAIIVIWLGPSVCKFKRFTCGSSPSISIFCSVPKAQNEVLLVY